MLAAEKTHYRETAAGESAERQEKKRITLGIEAGDEERRHPFRRADMALPARDPIETLVGGQDAGGFEFPPVRLGRTDVGDQFEPRNSTRRKGGRQPRPRPFPLPFRANAWEYNGLARHSKTLPELAIRLMNKY